VSGNWASLGELEAVGDWDGDGGADLVGKLSSGTLYLLRFSPTGAYLGPTAIGAGWQTYTGLTGPGDIDGDGKVDLLARDASGVLWAYRSNGTGGFLPRFKIGAGWSPYMFGS